MKRFIIFVLIACFAALLVLPLAGCKGSGGGAKTGTSDSSGGGLGGHNKDIDKELGN